MLILQVDFMQPTLIDEAAFIPYHQPYSSCSARECPAMAYARACAIATGPRATAGSGRCGIVQKMVLVSSSFGGGYSLRFRLYLLHLVLKSSPLVGYRARALMDLLMSRGRVYRVSLSCSGKRWQGIVFARWRVRELI